MKTGMPVIIIGVTMFLVGLLLFYSIESSLTDPFLGMIKNSGTFIGLSGMGVTLAGIIIYLINRNEPPLKESFDI